MHTNRFRLAFLVILSAFTAIPALSATTVDINRLVKLEPGHSYRAFLVDPLDETKLTESEYLITSSSTANGRVRYDLDEIIRTDDAEFVFHTAELTFAQTTSGITLYERRFGGTPEDMVEFAVLAPSGLTVPRYRKLDVESHITASTPLTNAAGAAWGDNGCAVGLLSLNNGLLQGRLISWDLDLGPSVSIWAKTTGGLCGFELDYMFYLVTEVLK